MPARDGAGDVLRFERADDAGVQDHALELQSLFDAIEAPDEIREGWYSDESRLSEIFDIFTTKTEIEDTMKRIGLSEITAASLLIDALCQIRLRSRPN